jgi:hypothetical protein
MANPPDEAILLRIANEHLQKVLNFDPYSRYPGVADIGGADGKKFESEPPVGKRFDRPQRGLADQAGPFPSFGRTNGCAAVFGSVVVQGDGDHGADVLGGLGDIDDDGALLHGPQARPATLSNRGSLSRRSRRAG